MFDKLFDFGNLNNFMQTMTQAANEKAVAAKETAEVNVREKERITDSAVEYNTEAQKALDRLQGVNAKGEEARQLAESMNPIDRITLIGEQILDPRNFTAEGRSRQISEMSQSLGVQGQIHNIQVNESAARIDEAVARETMATIGVDAKMATLRMQVDGLNLANQAIAQTETLRQQNLMQQDLPAIQKVLMGPPNPALKGKIAIAGMTYTPAEIQEREKALTTRNQLAMLAPQSTDPDFASKLRVHHDLQLANFALPELEALKANQYIMPDGTQVEPGVWDVHYTRQNQLQQQALTTQMNQLAIENQVPTMLKDSMQMATNLAPFANPGTPLAMARNGFIAASNNVAALAAQDVTPNGKMVQISALQQAQKQLIQAVDTEATKKAAGDKQLADIYRDQMLGQPIQPAQIEDVLRSRYIKGSGFGEILPNDAAMRVRKNADTNLAKMRQANASGFDAMGNEKSDKQLKEDAINEALEQERNEAGIVGINLIQRNVGQRKDNPAIKAGMVPGQLDEIQMRAHTIALDNVAQRESLSQAEILAIKNGKPADAGITAERAAMIAQSINVESVMTEYDLFEKQKPGLGYEMQQWYSTVLPELARNYTLGLDPIQQTLTGDKVLQEAQKLGQMYTMADESASSRGRQMATEISTGARRPENMWPVLLHTDKRLADSQKSTLFYDVIDPAIKQARARGANDEVATQAVFDALNGFKSDDPVLMGSLKTMMRELPTQLDNFQTTWTYILAQNQTSLRRVGLLKNNPEEANKQVRSVIPWMK
jgi:hypothetical protein